MACKCALVQQGFRKSSYGGGKDCHGCIWVVRTKSKSSELLTAIMIEGTLARETVSASPEECERRIQDHKSDGFVYWNRIARSDDGN